MDTDVAAPSVSEIIVRPVRDVDAESLGRVHAQCWHEAYDEVVSKATLENLSPRRMAELWTHWMNQGPAYRQFAAVQDGEIVGFSGSGPARDADAPRDRELYFINMLAEFRSTGTGQKLFDAAIADGEPAYLWVLSSNARARHFYEKNGFVADGAEHTEPFLGEEIHEVRYVR
jgi:GNAT superfamily N-acetyltransferase